MKNLEKFFPLFLTGGAFAVYQGLEKNIKDDFSLAKAALLTAFSNDSFCAYDELINRRLRHHESVDVYLADLKRLAELVDSSVSDKFLKCTFVCGLPEEIRSQLRAACALGKMDLSCIVERARLLIKSTETGMAASAKGVQRSTQDVRCYNCHALGHVSRTCPQRGAELKPSRTRRCYVCGDPQHLASSCSKRFGSGTKNE